MTSILIRKLLIILMVLSMALPQKTNAQDPSVELPNTYITPDGSFSVQFPQNWIVTIDPDLSNFILITAIPFAELEFGTDSEEGVLIGIVPPANISHAFPYIDEIPSTPHDLLELLMDDPTDSTTYFDIEVGTLNDYPAAFVDAEEDNVEGQLFAVDVGEGEIAVAVAGAYNMDYASQQETVVSILSSMTLHEYESGDYRLVTSPAVNLSFEMPAEYIYDDTSDAGALIFGSNEAVLTNYAPTKGEFMGIFVTQEFFAETLIDGFKSTDHAIAVFSDSVISEEFEDVSFIELDRANFDDKPISEMLMFIFHSDVVDGLLIAFEFDNGQIIIGAFFTYTDELDDFDQIMSLISLSVRLFNTPAADTDNS